MSAEKTNKVEKGDEVGAILCDMVQETFSNKMTLGQRPEEV